MNLTDIMRMQSLMKRSSLLKKSLAAFSLFLIFSCKTQQTANNSDGDETPEVVEPEIPSEQKVEELDTTKPAEVTPEELPDTVAIEKEVLKNEPPIDVAEFRAAWIATVANINWPSRSGLPTAQQQQEAIKLLDFLANHNYNAVIFQVRPQADALYESELEPWSYFLTGQQGKAPDPYYDPLNFWIKEAHQRGMELHVWLNPYRAYHTTGGEIGAASVVKTNPEMVVKLQNGMYWMDPSREDVQDRTAAVVQDLVQRYDVDGIHFDDYFYPYDSYNGGKDFPDDQSWNAYKNSGGKLSRGDWRRKNVDDFIERVAKMIKNEKRFVKFGISPFGIWRPGYPQSIAGYDQYEKLYADAKKWLNEGWVDYLTPQLYWKTAQTAQSFPVLLNWWQEENTQNRHIWPGINAGLIKEEGYENELFNQLMITRGMLSKDAGAVLWDLKTLMNDKEAEKALAENYFRKPALVPASPWMDDKAPKSPEVSTNLDANTLRISWTHPNPNEVFKWVLYFQYEGSKWDFKILNADQFSALKTTLSYLVGEKKVKLSKIGITAVDRTGNQSDFKEIILE
ncbi:glycoside hydrolase family 10 protein [Zunongwangia endophytica]|uniref:Glycoside hydrolase family 10 protein n=1 Tax=Zunongwangia endophytica TaxID=1808945 RepID=A0ABV8H399_9FLAO|nr:family 10 glycosylhydrolase [Zunongwangia endophytica]MDN3595944.1 family 10 glycosylhydrolase [Zunongwangia endophytica]